MYNLFFSKNISEFITADILFFVFNLLHVLLCVYMTMYMYSPIFMYNLMSFDKHI